MQRVALPLALLLILVASAAYAFTPDDAELSKKMKRAYGPLHSWKVVVTFDDYRGVKADVWQNGLSWRQEWTFPGQPFKAVAVGRGGSVAAACPAEYPLPLTLFWNLPDPVSRWEDLGVDHTVSGFGFEADIPSYILGSATGKDVAPQVWLNNETMSPIRFRFSLGGSLLEFRFTNYTVLGGFDLPQEGACLLPDGKSINFSMQWSDLNNSDEPDLYDTQAVRESVMMGQCPVPADPFDTLYRHYSAVPALQE